MVISFFRGQRRAKVDIVGGAVGHGLFEKQITKIYRALSMSKMSKRMDDMRRKAKAAKEAKEAEKGKAA